MANSPTLPPWYSPPGDGGGNNPGDGDYGKWKPGMPDGPGADPTPPILDPPTSPPTIPDEPSVPVVRIPASNIPRVSERRILLAGEGSLVPYAYGRVAMNRPRVRAVGRLGGKIVMALVWCLGEVDAIETVYNNDEPFTGSVTNYTGTQAQTVDPTLAAAISGFNDAMKGVCYSVVQVSATDANVSLTFSAIIRGRKVFDPRASTTAYSANPALVFRDIATSMGLSPDDDSIETAANYCDEQKGGANRWEMHLAFDQPRPIDKQLQLVAEYAGCYMVRDAGVVKLLPDRETATTHSFSDDPADVAAGATEIVQGSFDVEKRPLDKTPNQSIVEFQVQQGWPWKVRYIRTSEPTGQQRPTTFRMPGFNTANRARRFALTRQNKWNVTDLFVRWEAFDEALSVEIGDVVEVTHDIGLNAKRVRVMDIRAGSHPGLWRFEAEEYDPAVYSAVEVLEPTYDDIDLPSPSDVPDGPEIDATEKLAVDEGGRTFSRWEITWEGLDWPFVEAYRIRVTTRIEGTLDEVETFFEGNTTHLGELVDHVAVTPPVIQDVEYTIRIWAVSVFNQLGDPFELKVTALGKKLLPLPPTNGRGFEAGQFVSLSWDAAMDIDLVGYRVKRISQANYDLDPAEAWDSPLAVVVDARVDAERTLIPAQPEGSFYYMVKSLDSLGQESDSEDPPWGRVDIPINVTADGAGNNAVMDLGAGTLTHMRVYVEYGVARWAITEEGLSWDDVSGYSDDWGVLGGFTEAWFADQDVSSTFQSEEWDVEVNKNAMWSWLAYVELYGYTMVSYTTQLSKDADYPTFTDFGGLSANGEGRYFRGQIEGSTGLGFRVKLPVQATFQGQATQEEITVSIPASPQPKSVVFDKTYVNIPKVAVLPLGSAPRIVTADNITTGGLDLYAWDSSFASAACDVIITITGV